MHTRRSKPLRDAAHPFFDAPSFRSGRLRTGPRLEPWCQPSALRPACALVCLFPALQPHLSRSEVATTNEQEQASPSTLYAPRRRPASVTACPASAGRDDTAATGEAVCSLKDEPNQQLEGLSTQRLRLW